MIVIKAINNVVVDFIHLVEQFFVILLLNKNLASTIFDNSAKRCTVDLELIDPVNENDNEPYHDLLFT